MYMYMYYYSLLSELELLQHTHTDKSLSRKKSKCGAVVKRQRAFCHKSSATPLFYHFLQTSLSYIYSINTSTYSSPLMSIAIIEWPKNSAICKAKKRSEVIYMYMYNSNSSQIKLRGSHYKYISRLKLYYTPVRKKELDKKKGPVRDLNPGPLAP